MKIYVGTDESVYKLAEWGELVCVHQEIHKELVEPFNPDFPKATILVCHNPDCTGIEQYEMSELMERSRFLDREYDCD